MKKMIYVSRTLFISASRHLWLTWLLVLTVSAGLTMTFGIVANFSAIQKYYANKDMSELAYYVDSFSEFYSDQKLSAKSKRDARNELMKLPGLKEVYEQILFYVDDIGRPMFCIGYPSALVDRLHIPTNIANEEVGSFDTLDAQTAIWLDYRLSNIYKKADRLELTLQGELATKKLEFTVAGFLNSENAHYDFQSGASAESFSKDIVKINPDYYVSLFISDGMFSDLEYDADRSAAKFLLPSRVEDKLQWRTNAKRNGLGQISNMEDVLRNDKEQIDSMTKPIMVLCFVILLLTLIGLFGTQFQQMNRHRQIAFSLSLCGMDWLVWEWSWIIIAGLPLCIASIAGCMLGNLWRATILLEPLALWSVESLILSIAIAALATLGVLPMIGRWSHMQVIQFRRDIE